MALGVPNRLSPRKTAWPRSRKGWRQPPVDFEIWNLKSAACVASGGMGARISRYRPREKVFRGKPLVHGEPPPHEEDSRHGTTHLTSPLPVMVKKTCGIVFGEVQCSQSFLPHGVMVAQLTLDQFVEVRILMRQPSSGEHAAHRPIARSFGPGNCQPAVSAVSSVGRAYAF